MTRKCRHSGDGPPQEDGVEPRVESATPVGDVDREPHFSVKAIAQMWSLSTDSIQRLFVNEKGVLKLYRPGTRYKRSHMTLRIPLSVMRRVHRRLHG